ncbi:MAG: 30S ribosomal protein S17 [Chloroflexi bacterium]|nr:30S ribosomal protein S17 [Chloroflexota bacterium]
MERKVKSRVGRVVGDKMEKTVVVAIETRRRHRVYSKVVTRRVNVKAHDEASTCKLGDLVKIGESRPISRTKRWRVLEVVSKGISDEVRLDDTDI